MRVTLEYDTAMHAPREEFERIHMLPILLGIDIQVLEPIARDHIIRMSELTSEYS